MTQESGELSQALAEFIFGQIGKESTGESEANPGEPQPEAPVTTPPGVSTELCTLFVGDLSRTTTEDELRSILGPHGEIVNINIKRDIITHNNLGYAFVTFKSHEQAGRVLQKCNGLDIAGRKLRVGWAQKNTTISVTNLDESIDINLLKSTFQAFGPLVEEDSFIRYGEVVHIRYKTRADAEAAKAALHLQHLGSTTIRIGWADQIVRKNCIFLQFDAKHARQLSEARMVKRLNEFGPIASINMPRDLATGRLKGYAFVHYAESDDGEAQAAAAIEALTRAGKLDNLHVRCNYARRQGWKGDNAAAEGVSLLSPSSGRERKSFSSSSSSRYHHSSSTPPRSFSPSSSSRHIPGSATAAVLSRLAAAQAQAQAQVQAQAQAQAQAQQALSFSQQTPAPSRQPYLQQPWFPPSAQSGYQYPYLQQGAASSSSSAASAAALSASFNPLLLNQSLRQLSLGGPPATRPVPPFNYEANSQFFADLL